MQCHRHASPDTYDARAPSSDADAGPSRPRSRVSFSQATTNGEEDLGRDRDSLECHGGSSDGGCGKGDKTQGDDAGPRDRGGSQVQSEGGVNGSTGSEHERRSSGGSPNLSGNDRHHAEDRGRMAGRNGVRKGESESFHFELGSGW